ncbi:XTP/dITP diphosphatase [[Clostridium] polysaccharolyticum]|jgi:XTP/dITP diphosphohydrolase|uniref:dITP/XTP pyrophosphatase n=1 Tax=[Clostridium] polysaccharolyticum TaxID=29364 RepID=A0A1I0FV62_9FIRM|nr:XTP/dITP diphosphatase [[Clostridium] polysaccharolyticum]SET61346.1 XTP/dITP diphosphohydrolase [[Clostridium] polysaccharolyticum]
MKEIIFATTNQGKVKELKMILKDLGVKVLSLKDINLNVDIKENGTTYEENALIKATTIARLTNKIVLADDSGLEVDYLDKAPGVLSARFMGEDTSYDIKNQAIIDKLANAKGSERSARFVSAIACAMPNGETFTTRGTIEGEIGYKIEGTEGFGYDPIFYVPEFGCTTAELTPEQKNKISHRGKALEEMKKILIQKI